MNVTSTMYGTAREDGTFAAGGVTYHRLRITPRDRSATVARLAVLHGYGDHSGRYAEAMTWLASRGGVACHAFDFRGHGRSSGRRAYVRRWDEYLDDLDAFLSQPEFSRDSTDDVPLFVLAHSHGGLVAAMAGVRGLLARHGISGCILSAPYLVNALHVPRHKAAAARALNVLCPWLRIRSGITPEMASSDPEKNSESRQDPLLLRSATPRWYVGQQVAQAEVLRGAGNFTLPLLMVQGDADPIAAPRGARVFYDLVASADKSFVDLPGFLHEPLREAGREHVFAAVLEWVARRAAE